MLGLMAIGVGLATVAVLGPLAAGVVDYHVTETLRNQTIGLDAVSLLVVAPLCCPGRVARPPPTRRRRGARARHRRLHELHVRPVHPRARVRAPAGQQRAALPALPGSVRRRMDRGPHGVEHDRGRAAAALAAARPARRPRRPATPRLRRLLPLHPVARRLDELAARGRRLPRRAHLLLGDRDARSRHLPAGRQSPPASASSAAHRGRRRRSTRSSAGSGSSDRPSRRWRSPCTSTTTRTPRPAALCS